MGNGNEPFPKAVLRLFVSIDIVGSTAYKQSAKKENSDNQLGQPWLQAFSGFFSEIEGHLNAQWRQSKKNLGDDLGKRIGNPPQFWKAAGDEAIYVQEITDVIQPLCTLATVRETIRAYRPLLRKISPNLDLKAASWLAGFPINNAEVVLGGSAGDTAPSTTISKEMNEWFVGHLSKLFEYYKILEAGKKPAGFLDFIGPQMDLGFRLSAKATPRRMMMSADLALLLVQGFHAEREKWTGRFDIQDQIQLFGTEPMKGVLSGVPYPQFWFDIAPDKELNLAEDVVAKVQKPSLDEVSAYCREFISTVGTHHKWLIPPFIACEGRTNHGDIPERHKKELQSMQERWADASKALEDARKAPDTAKIDELMAKERLLELRNQWVEILKAPESKT